jgi:hypothetical protein
MCQPANNEKKSVIIYGVLQKFYVDLKRNYSSGMVIKVNLCLKKYLTMIFLISHSDCNGLRPKIHQNYFADLITKC